MRFCMWIETAGMPVADRRRPDGSRRAKSARAIHTPAFVSSFREAFALREMRARPRFGRCELPRRRRSCRMGTAETRLRRGKLPLRNAATRNAATRMRQQSQRDCVLQPRVARNELPWEIVPSEANPNGVVADVGQRAATPLELGFFPALTQGSSCLATLGFEPESR